MGYGVGEMGAIAALIDEDLFPPPISSIFIPLSAVSVEATIKAKIPNKAIKL